MDIVQGAKISEDVLNVWWNHLLENPDIVSKFKEAMSNANVLESFRLNRLIMPRQTLQHLPLSDSARQIFDFAKGKMGAQDVAIDSSSSGASVQPVESEAGSYSIQDGLRQSLRLIVFIYSAVLEHKSFAGNDSLSYLGATLDIPSPYHFFFLFTAGEHLLESDIKALKKDRDRSDLGGFFSDKYLQQIIETSLARGDTLGVRVLVESFGCFVEEPWFFGKKSLLQMGVDSNNIDSLKYLLNIGVEDQPMMQETRVNLALLEAAKLGKLAVLECLVSYGECDEEARNQRLQVALFVAAQSGNVDALRWLMGKGIGLNQKDERGVGIIHYVAQSGKVDALQWLVEQGVDINQADATGMTALHYAAQSGKVDALQLLVEQGVNINQQDSNGMTALHYAAQSRHDACSQVLVEAGADIFIKNNDDKCPRQIDSELQRPRSRFSFRSPVGYLNSRDCMLSVIDKAINDEVVNLAILQQGVMDIKAANASCFSALFCLFRCKEAFAGRTEAGVKSWFASKACQFSSVTSEVVEGIVKGTLEVANPIANPAGEGDAASDGPGVGGDETVSPVVEMSRL